MLFEFDGIARHRRGWPVRHPQGVARPTLYWALDPARTTKYARWVRLDVPGLAPGRAGQRETRDSSGSSLAKPPGHRVERVAAGEHVVKNHDELASNYRGVRYN